MATPLELMLAALPRLTDADKERMVDACLVTLDTAAVGRIQAACQARTRSSFRHGQKVEFVARGRTVRMVIERINDKTLGGTEVETTRAGMKWRVAPSLCRIVSTDPAPRRPVVPAAAPAPTAPLVPRVLPTDYGDF